MILSGNQEKTLKMLQRNSPKPLHFRFRQKNTIEFSV